MTAKLMHTSLAIAHDIEEMTESQRFDEIAKTLACSVLRLHKAGAMRIHNPKTYPESSQTCLDLSQSSRPHRAPAVNAAENLNGRTT